MIVKKTGYILMIFALCAGSVMAQKAERKNVREGNKQYGKDNYTESEVAYRKSIEVNPRSVEGIYNLGNALYKQEKYPEATEQYQLMAGQGERLIDEDPDNIERLAHVFHNLGNIGMKGQQYEQSIEAYKQSLRLNPSDDDTRYNLALAQKLLNDQQEQQQDQDNQDQNEDQEQEQKEQEQDQNQDQQQDQKQDQKEQEQQQQNEQISRENAQQMLDAFLQDERETQEKVRQAQMLQQESRKREKQW
jgi:Na+/phosphate symporter